MHHSTTFRPGGVLLLMAACTTAGCGDSNPLGRKAISGTIQFKGAPLDQGSIAFEPSGGGVTSGGLIQDGHYSIVAEKGLPPGEYVVQIFSPTESQTPPTGPTVPGPVTSNAGPSQPPPGVERIPPDFNVESTKTIEVTDEGPNQFDFEIP